MSANRLYVLRRIDNIDANARSSISADKHLYVFEDGTTWVDNDQVWDNEIVGYIMKATMGFKVVDEQFNLVAGPYRDLAKAEQARKSAKITVNVIAEVEDEDDAALVAAAASDVGGSVPLGV